MGSNVSGCQSMFMHAVHNLHNYTHLCLGAKVKESYGSPGSPLPSISALQYGCYVLPQGQTLRILVQFLALTQTYLCVIPHEASSLTASILQPPYQLLDQPTSEFQQEQVLRPLLISLHLPPFCPWAGEMAPWVEWGLLHKPEDLELRSQHSQKSQVWQCASVGHTSTGGQNQKDPGGSLARG